MNWERWGIGCCIGVFLFGIYGLIEFFYNKQHGPPMTSANHDVAEDVWGHEDGGVEAKSGSKDLELGAGEAAASKVADHEVGVQSL
jgi:hypothetical protein